MQASDGTLYYFKLVDKEMGHRKVSQRENKANSAVVVEAVGEAASGPSHYPGIGSAAYTGNEVDRGSP